jgi:ATP-binding cassette, subfamily A (ABC1), member 3
MKREMWGTLRSVAAGKAVVITTRMFSCSHLRKSLPICSPAAPDSMEEASALANKVGILATRMLAIGSPEELEARYATYEVHLSGRTRADADAARTAMLRVPGARQAEDVAMRFEVPVRTSGRNVESDGGVSLAELFSLLQDAGVEWAVERPTLESVFIKVIREHEVEEEDARLATPGRGTWAWIRRMC